MKKIISFIIAAFMLFSICPLTFAEGKIVIEKVEIINAAAVPVTGVTLDKTYADLTVGDSLTLTATVKPADATNKGVTWESMDSTIAEVSSSGVVTAVAAGMTVIKVKTNDGGFTASCVINVSSRLITSVVVTDVIYPPAAGDKVGDYMSASIPADANYSIEAVAWFDFTSFAQMTDDDVFEAGRKYLFAVGLRADEGYEFDSSPSMSINGGEIAVYSMSGVTSDPTAFCLYADLYTVPYPTVSVTGVELDCTSATLTAGDTLKLTATVKPADATYKGVKWSSSDTAVATVSSFGVVTAVAAGTVTVTVTTNDGGYTATCAITVNADTVPVTGVTLNKTSATLTVGESIDLTATVNPSNADNKNFGWSSTDSSVASVSSSGHVIAVAPGTVTITVMTEDGGFTAECIITVNSEPVETYTVTFVDGLTEEVISTVTVAEGADVEFPEAPEHEGYTFTGWDKDGKNIIADITITAQYELAVVIGDLNGDGKINTADAVIVLKISAGMIAQDENNSIAGDCNFDGEVNTADAVLILKYSAGMIEKF